MRILYRFFFCLAALVIISGASALPAAAKSTAKKAADVSAVYFPSVQLKHWKNSTSDERFAFLAGFVSMLEVERAWQGNDLLPIKESTVGTWVRGLSGVTLKDMDMAVNEYIATHPNDLERNVVEVLGRLYVRPKMTAGERKTAGARYDVLKTGFATPAR